MDNPRRIRYGAITRDAIGPGAAEAFIIIAIATILITRLYLQMTGYPQVGGGDLHIAHALYGGALMMLALIIGWLTIGFGTRALCVVLGGIGFGLFLDEVGKFVTKDNDYFYGPSAEIMYILVVVILVGARIIRDFRPLSAQECLASAAAIAADGIARGLADRRREIGLSLVERARTGGRTRRTSTTCGRSCSRLTTRRIGSTPHSSARCGSSRGSSAARAGCRSWAG